MKDPIHDLCQLIRRLPRDARERFINNAAVAVGHPRGEELVIPDPATGETLDVATTVGGLECCLRRLVRESHFDDKFLVCGLLHEVSEGQRRAAEPQARADALDMWFSFIAQVDEELRMPESDRPDGRSDSALRLAKAQYEEEAGDVDCGADDAGAAHEAIEREWAQTFDDAYWRERQYDLIRMALGGRGPTTEPAD